MNIEDELRKSSIQVVPSFETTIYLKVKTDLSKKRSEKKQLSMFYVFDFFCFYSLEEELGTSPVVVRFWQIQSNEYNKTKKKSKLVLKSNAEYSFVIESEEDGVTFDKLINDKLIIYKTNGLAITKINEDQQKIIAVKYIQSKMRTVERVSQKEIANDQSFNIKKVQFSTRTQYVYPKNTTDSDSSFILESDRDILQQSTVLEQNNMYALPRGPKFAEIEALLANIETNKLLKSHIWYGVAYYYKLSNICGAFSHDPNMKNYSKPVFVIMFTSKPNIRDFHLQSTEALTQIFHNNYWQSLLPPWMEPNTAYVFAMDQKNTFKIGVDAYPYSNIISL
jgi:hypothetical protein